MKKITQQQIEEILALYKKSISIGKISKKVNLSYFTVYRTINPKYRDQALSQTFKKDNLCSECGLLIKDHPRCQYCEILIHTKGICEDCAKDHPCIDKDIENILSSIQDI